MASHTLAFPARRSLGGRPVPSRHPAGNAMRNDRQMVTGYRSAGNKVSTSRTRLHLVAGGAKQVNQTPSLQSGKVAAASAAQARQVAAQVDLEIARQVFRRRAVHPAPGTLIVLPRQVTRPSLFARTAGVLRRLLNPHRDSLLRA